MSAHAANDTTLAEKRQRLGVSAKKKPACPCGHSLGHPWPWGFREKGNELSINFGIGIVFEGISKMFGGATRNSQVAIIDLANRNDFGAILGHRFIAE